MENATYQEGCAMGSPATGPSGLASGPSANPQQGQVGGQQPQGAPCDCEAAASGQPQGFAAQQGVAYQGQAPAACQGGEPAASGCSGAPEAGAPQGMAYGQPAGGPQAGAGQAYGSPQVIAAGQAYGGPQAAPMGGPAGNVPHGTPGHAPGACEAGTETPHTCSCGQHEAAAQAGPAAPQGPMFGPQPGMAYGAQPGAGYGTQPGMAYGVQPGQAYGPQPGQAYGPQPGATFGPQYGPMPGQAPQPEHGGCDGRHGASGGPTGPGGFAGFAGQPGFGPQAFAAMGSDDPQHLQNRYGQMLELCNELMQGKADPVKIASFLTTSGTYFWKGAIVGALATFVLTNASVKSAIRDSVSSVFGASKKPSAD